MRRRLSILLLASLSACGWSGDEVDQATQQDNSEIECRYVTTPGSGSDCTVEAIGDEFLIRKADGGFRRLRLVDGGRGLAAADGAEVARVTRLDGDNVRVEIGGDVFRLRIRLLP